MAMRILTGAVALAGFALAGLLFACEDDTTPTPTQTPVLVKVTATPLPTPYPTYTPAPTYTPVPTATAMAVPTRRRGSHLNRPTRRCQRTRRIPQLHLNRPTRRCQRTRRIPQLHLNRPIRRCRRTRRIPQLRLRIQPRLWLPVRRRRHQCHFPRSPKMELRFGAQKLCLICCSATMTTRLESCANMRASV